MQNTLIIEYTDELLFALGVSGAEFSDEAKFLLAVKLYEMGRISSGQTELTRTRSSGISKAIGHRANTPKPRLIH